MIGRRSALIDKTGGSRHWLPQPQWLQLLLGLWNEPRLLWFFGHRPEFNMPLLSLVRFLTTLLSLALLALTAYLAWSWYEGDVLRQADGDLVRTREDWRLWAAAALLVFSSLGKLVFVPLLAGRDTGEHSKEDRGVGQLVGLANGSQIYVEVLGQTQGPTLILTHGWAMDSTIWHYAKLALTRSFRVIVWDLPGLGQSKGEISLENFAANLAALAEWSGAPKVVLVGHSIGGMTIQTMARDNPTLFAERVAGVVLLNTTYTNPLRTMILPRFMQAIRWPLLEPVMRLTILLEPLAWLIAWQSYFSGTAHLANRVGFGKYVKRSQLNHVTLLATKNRPRNIEKGNLAMFRWDATGALARLGVPTLLLVGELDIVTKPEASSAIAAQSQTAALQVIEGVNHMGMLERADQYNARIAAFAAQMLNSTIQR
jgi:pimeloyl-ACP methyl ester carboxylesterase